MFLRITCVIILFSCFNNSLLAAVYTREYTYNALEADSSTSSRVIAIDHVRTLLLQKIGAHIQQTIKISEDGLDDSFARKDVAAVTAGLATLSILEEKWDKSSYYIKAAIDADTQPVLDALEIYKNNHSENSRQLLKSLKRNEQALQKSREKIAHLKAELEFSTTGKQNTKTVTAYNDEVTRLSMEEIFVEGFKHHQQREYAAAIEKYREIAKQGNVVAQQLLGSLYMNGEGVEQDIAKAIYWFQTAAEKGEAIAQYYLGILYLKGNGVEQDTSTAVDWLHKSADQDDTFAQLKLGSMYLEGKGVEQKFFKAAYWFRKAAEHQEAEAQLQLGKMYAAGKGVAQNDDEALYWYKKAAEQGSDEAKMIVKGLDKNNQK